MEQAQLFERYKENPILTPAEWPYSANAVFNAGATLLESGETLLLVRVEDFRGISHFTAARSLDGYANWRVSSEPTLRSEPEKFPEEQYGIEDCRITPLSALGKFGIVYTGYSSCGPGVSLTLTEDFQAFEKLGAILPPDNKDAALFPRRFNDRWFLIHRPSAESHANIWLASSPDLKHWGDHRLLMEARTRGWWDAGKIGLSPQPIETEEGWLIIYHGVRRTMAGGLYRIGLALLDLEEPWKVIRRGDEWVFGPETVYERMGDVGNVVFSCGVTHIEEEDELRLYYGAADTCMAVATAKLSEVIDWLLGQ